LLSASSRIYSLPSEDEGSPGCILGGFRSHGLSITEPSQTPFDTAVRYSPKPQHTRTVRIVSGACFQPLIASFRRRAWIFGRLRPSLAPSLLSRSWIEQCGVDEHGYTCSAPKMDTLSDWTLRRELRKSHRLYSCNLESFPHQITPIRSSRCAFKLSCNRLKNLVSYR
jgi:hypothetical protein